MMLSSSSSVSKLAKLPPIPLHARDRLLRMNALHFWRGGACLSRVRLESALLSYSLACDDSMPLGLVSCQLVSIALPPWYVSNFVQHRFFMPIDSTAKSYITSVKYSKLVLTSQNQNRHQRNNFTFKTQIDVLWRQYFRVSCPSANYNLCIQERS